MRAELSWQGRSGVVEVDGVAVATLHRALLSERAEVDIHGLPWSVARVRGEILATDPSGSARHRARGIGLLRRRWSANLDDRVVQLQAAGSRSWQVQDSEGTQLLGEVRVTGVFRQRILAELPDSTRPDVAMFLLWFAYVLQRRRNANAAG